MLKIGMYTEDEIFEYMTDCEGSMLGRSMYDAIFDKMHALITENEQLKQDIDKTINSIETTIQIIGQQPSRDEEEDKYILSRLESFIKILKGD